MTTVNPTTYGKTYKQLQVLGRELREQGYNICKLNAKREELEASINAALVLVNEKLRERNQQQVFGNMKPVHQAGTRANLMAGSKARAARSDEALVVNKKYQQLNKQFNKALDELSIPSTEVKRASNAFSYKQMKHSNAYLTNGASI